MDFKTFLFELSQTPVRVIAPTVDFSQYVPIDLSKDNKALKDFDTSCSQSWSAYINQYLQDRNKSIAFGGYLETRSIYTRSTYFETNNALESRNIHLGVDLLPILQCLEVLDGIRDKNTHKTHFTKSGCD